MLVLLGFFLSQNKKTQLSSGYVEIFKAVFGNSLPGVIVLWVSLETKSLSELVENKKKYCIAELNHEV